jgi:Sec-independent protein translocase protein TatA
MSQPVIVPVAPAEAAAPAGAGANLTQKLRLGGAVVGLLLLVYVIAHVSSFMSSPMGQALKALASAAAGILTALAGLPPWLLIGLGAAFLFGPAVMKMAGSLVRTIAEVSKGGNDAAKDLEAKGVPKEAIEALAKGAASQAVERARELQYEQSGSPEELKALQQAQQVSDNVATESGKAGFEEEDGQGREIADQAFEAAKARAKN